MSNNAGGFAAFSGRESTVLTMVACGCLNQHNTGPMVIGIHKQLPKVKK